MIYNNYPYTDLHELNLDWLLDEVTKALDVLSKYATKEDLALTNGEVSKIKQTIGNVETNVNVMNGAIKKLKSDLSSAEADILQKVDSNTLNTELNNLHDDIINQIDDECEKLSNKKTIIDGEANNVNYPTTLAVYNAMGSIREYSDNAYEKLTNKVTTFDGVGNETDYPSTSAVYDRITRFRTENPEVVMFYYNNTGDSSTYEQIRDAVNSYGVRALFLLHIQREGEDYVNYAVMTREYNNNNSHTFDFVYDDVSANETTVYTCGVNGWSIRSIDSAKVIKTGFVNGFGNGNYNLSSLFNSNISKIITTIPVGTTDASVAVQVVNASSSAFTINISRSGTGGNLQVNYID